MFNLFRPRIHPVNGVLPDERPQEEKEKDWVDTELISAANPVSWDNWEEWKRDPAHIKMLNDIQVNNQDGVGSCFAQALSLHLAINNYLEEKKFIKMSAKPIYARRRNNPKPGMYWDDGSSIAVKYGTVPEVLYPSPNKPHTMDDLNGFLPSFEGIGKIYRAGSYIKVMPDIERFAYWLSLGFPITYTILFGEHEWGRQAVPKILEKPTLGHGNVFLPFSNFIYQGRRAFLTQDSWGTGIGIGGRRIITEDWFNAHRILIGILLKDINDLAIFNQPAEHLPKYTFKRDLYVGKRGADVSMLQTILSMIKDDDGYLFPLWQGQSPSGYFGGITRAAVKRYQLKYHIEPALGYFGIKTRTHLNNLIK